MTKSSEHKQANLLDTPGFHSNEGLEAAEGGGGSVGKRSKVLLVDDEHRFRQLLATRLELRGYDVLQTGDGEEAIRLTRGQRPEVVVLDRKMPGMDGEEVLREIKRITPEVQVIMLTGHASLSSAAASGKLRAFAYLEKPIETEVLVETIDAAREERLHDLARNEVPVYESRSIWGWLWGTYGFRPGIMMLGAAIFAAIYLIPTPSGLREILSAEKTGDRSADLIGGYASYGQMREGESIAAYYSRSARRSVRVEGPNGQETERPLNADETAQAAKVMVGVLVLCALFWATGALPVGVTALLVGLLMYLFHIFPANMVAQSYAKDSVIFILGVLALAVVVAKTGLDRRIGLVLLGTSRSLATYLFVFCPLLAMSAAFLSEHALVAFITPILMVVYMGAIKAAKLKSDRTLAITLILALNFAANQGGPGSPAAGGRNAVMVGILSDYGVAPTFGEWMMMGMPFVPVMALVIATYFYLAVGRKSQLRNLDIAAMVRRESKKLGKMTRQEWITLAVFACVVVLWIMSGETEEGLGMGGPALLGLVALAVFGILTWRDITKISWEVVALYAAATAMGAGLASTGGALWMARGFIDLLPDYFTSGEGLCVAASFVTGIITNFMSDGATVSAMGPITVPMATISGTHPWMVGLATAFASSFANMLVVGTPNNAIAYSLAKDYETGEQLIRLSDFFKHGLVITLLAFCVLWGWVIFGYWRWIDL